MYELRFRNSIGELIRYGKTTTDSDVARAWLETLLNTQPFLPVETWCVPTDAKGNKIGDWRRVETKGN